MGPGTSNDNALANESKPTRANKKKKKSRRTKRIMDFSWDESNNAIKDQANTQSQHRKRLQDQSTTPGGLTTQGTIEIPLDTGFEDGNVQQDLLKAKETPLAGRSRRKINSVIRGPSHRQDCFSAATPFDSEDRPHGPKEHHVTTDNSVRECERRVRFSGLSLSCCYCPWNLLSLNTITSLGNTIGFFPFAALAVHLSSFSALHTFSLKPLLPDHFD